MWLCEKKNTEINVFLQVAFSVLLDASVNKNVVFSGKLVFAFLYLNLQIKTVLKPYSILSIRNMPERCQLIGTFNIPSK